MITLYTLDDCPHCNEVKELLERENTPFIVKYMDNAEDLSELRYDGNFDVVAPVIKIDDEYFTYEQFMEKNGL